ncbi:MAG: hypothetical protein K2H08_06610, partial [Duncaniella sp.]|nr:hypothetical protein [Duncaniella sp.]
MIPRDILLENSRRNAALLPVSDPVIGDESDPERRPYCFNGKTYYLPADMLSDPRLGVAVNATDFA